MPAIRLPRNRFSGFVSPVLRNLLIAIKCWEESFACLGEASATG